VLAPNQTPEGPVLIGIQYRARPGQEDEFMAALRQTKNSRAHLERVRGLTDPGHRVIVTHWLAVSSRKQPRSPAKPA
jgi:hypothetical protein